EAGTVAARPGLAERRDANHDERTADRRERFPSEIPALERPGSEVLGQDVRLRDQAPDQRLPLRLSQVAGNRLLVARLDEPPVGAAGVGAGGSAQASQVVADARLLDLDHLGAELAEQRGAYRRRQIGRE